MERASPIVEKLPVLAAFPQNAIKGIYLFVEIQSNPLIKTVKSGRKIAFAKSDRSEILFSNTGLLLFLHMMFFLLGAAYQVGYNTHTIKTGNN